MASKPFPLLVAWVLALASGACDRDGLDARGDAEASGSAAAPLLGASADASRKPTAAVSRNNSAREMPAFRAPLPVRKRTDNAPAKRYAALTPAECRARASARKLPVKPAKGKFAGLETPFELTGPLQGVTFEVPRSVYGRLDCRMAVMLDDLAKQLAQMGVVTVEVNNIYRPGAERTAEPPRDKARPVPKSKRDKRPPSRRSARSMHPSQHALGLAIDIMAFRLGDGSTLDVERDWRGKRGAPACGPESEVIGEDSAAISLRNITCAIARAGYCSHLITPSRDEAHRDHLHCDIAQVDEVDVE